MDIEERLKYNLSQIEKGISKPIEMIDKILRTIFIGLLYGLSIAIVYFIFFTIIILVKIYKFVKGRIDRR